MRISLPVLPDKYSTSMIMFPMLWKLLASSGTTQLHSSSKWNHESPYPVCRH